MKLDRGKNVQEHAAQVGKHSHDNLPYTTVHEQEKVFQVGSSHQPLEGTTNHQAQSTVVFPQAQLTTKCPNFTDQLLIKKYLIWCQAGKS